MKRIGVLLSVITMIVLVGSFSSAAPDEGKAKKTRAAKNEAKNKAKSAKRSRAPAFTPEREAAALMFVRQHNKELAKLMPALKRSNPKEYQRAIRDLFRASERLASYHGKPKRHKVELQLWITNSQIQLLAARLQLSPDPEAEKQLRKLVRVTYDLQIKRLEEDRDRFAARLKQLDATIERSRKARDRKAQQKIDQLLRSLSQARAKRKKPHGKATKKASKKAKNLKAAGPDERSREKKKG